MRVHASKNNNNIIIIANKQGSKQLQNLYTEQKKNRWLQAAF